MRRKKSENGFVRGAGKEDQYNEQHMSWIAKFLITPVVLLAAAEWAPGVFVESVYTAIIVAIILGILNIIVKPILVVLSLPVTILTLGLFLFVLDAAILWFVATFVEGFALAGFVPALILALLLAAAHWLAETLFSS